VLASIIGLGLSIDYSLFMVRRYREELAKGRDVRDAVGWTVATSGEAILFSALTVMIGFFGLLLIGIPFMTSLGIGGALVVGGAMLAALTLLPAVLSVLGTRVNALRIPFISRFTVVTAQDANRQGFWHRLALGVMQRPILVIVGVVALLVALGWPIFSIRLGLPAVTSLPQSSEARRGFQIMNRQFPATAQDPIYIIAQTPDGSNMLTPDNLARLYHLTQWLSIHDHITNVTSLTKIPAVPNAPALNAQQLIALYTSGAYKQNPALAQVVNSTTNGDTTLITAVSDTKLDSNAGKDLIDNLRANKDQGQGLTVMVGGIQAVSLDFTRYVYGNFSHAILFILIATYVLLLLMFRSVLLPLKAV
ncbi:MAG TPA: MMPL family transporter, partial [Ktedonobacterales bacterium]|nr:MMPL family transporter [Ktedonobacterales bacterium]